MVRSFPKIILLGDSLTEDAFGIEGFGSAMVSDVSLTVARYQLASAST
jgi:hypothetical protein